MSKPKRRRRSAPLPHVGRALGSPMQRALDQGVLPGKKVVLPEAAKRRFLEDDLGRRPERDVGRQARRIAPAQPTTSIAAFTPGMRYGRAHARQENKEFFLIFEGRHNP